MIYTDTKKILNTNTVMQFKDEDLFIHLEQFTVQLIFKQIANVQPSESLNVQGNLIQIELINYSEDAGIGLEKPRKIFSLDDKDIYINIRVSTLAVQAIGPYNRLVHYTIYQEK